MCERDAERRERRPERDRRKGVERSGHPPIGRCVKARGAQRRQRRQTTQSASDDQHDAHADPEARQRSPVDLAAAVAALRVGFGLHVLDPFTTARQVGVDRAEAPTHHLGRGMRRGRAQCRRERLHLRVGVGEAGDRERRTALRAADRLAGRQRRTARGAAERVLPRGRPVHGRRLDGVERIERVREARDVEQARHRAAPPAERVVLADRAAAVHALDRAAVAQQLRAIDQRHRTEQPLFLQELRERLVGAVATLALQLRRAAPARLVVDERERAVAARAARVGLSIACGSARADAIAPISSSSAGPLSCAVSVPSNQTRSQPRQRSRSTLLP